MEVSITRKRKQNAFLLVKEESRGAGLHIKVQCPGLDLERGLANDMTLGLGQRAMWVAEKCTRTFQRRYHLHIIPQTPGRAPQSVTGKTGRSKAHLTAGYPGAAPDHSPLRREQREQRKTSHMSLGFASRHQQPSWGWVGKKETRIIRHEGDLYFHGPFS